MQPTRRDRWMALGLLLLVAGAGYLLGIHPWWTVPMIQAGDRIDALKQRELRARMQIRQAPALEQRLRALQERQSAMPGLMAETSPERASAWLVRRLETAVSEVSPGNRSCAITSRSPLPPGTPEPFPKVAVQVRMQCGIAELSQVLDALESGSPRLFVENVRIAARRSATMAGSSLEGGLDVSFELHGHIAPPIPMEVSGAR